MGDVCVIFCVAAGLRGLFSTWQAATPARRKVTRQTSTAPYQQAQPQAHHEERRQATPANTKRHNAKRSQNNYDVPYAGALWVALVECGPELTAARGEGWSFHVQVRARGEPLEIWENMLTA